MKQLDYALMAKYYDILELDGWIDTKFNFTLEKLFTKYKIKNILDFSCWTWAQTEYFYKKWYNIIWVDISQDMLDIAKSKSSEIRYELWDMRTSRFWEFPCVISIYNAIWHLSRSDFEISLKNISENLQDWWIFIFDIFNFNYAIWNLHDKWFVWVKKEVDWIKFERLNQNLLNESLRKIKFNQKNTIQQWSERPKIIKHSWELQIYSSDELTDILNKNWFKVLEFVDVWGWKFDDKESYSILTVAQKV